MLTIHFEGWFQCRLATAPDPADEPRGISGWTFAVGDEPDFDRVIRLQNPERPRSRGPSVGVTVRMILVSGQQVLNHPLVGAEVYLLGEPKFEGRNGIVAEDAKEPIVPFHLKISGNGITLEREEPTYPPDRERRLHKINPSILKKLAPVSGSPNDVEAADAAGIMDYRAYRRCRKEKLEADLRKVKALERKEALRKRIRELEKTERALEKAENPDEETNMRPHRSLGWRVDYRFDLSGPAGVADEHNALGGVVGKSAPWRTQFWMGAWDADALCGYMRGKLEVPFRFMQR
jgi:hypothetical protein